MRKIILLLSFLLLFLIPLVSSDTGPHEAADLSFYVNYNNVSITENFNANLFACWADECKIDNFDICTNGACTFFYYRIERVPSKLMLKFDIPSLNKSFSSGAFGFSGNRDGLYYDINIKPDGSMNISASGKEYQQYFNDSWINKTLVPYNPNNPNNEYIQQYSYFHDIITSGILAFIVTIIIELITAVIVLKIWKIKKLIKPLLTIAIADVISVPLVWIIFFAISINMVSLFPINVIVGLAVAEVFAVVFEAYAIYLFNKRELTLKRAFWLSFIINAASFVIGGLLLKLFYL